MGGINAKLESEKTYKKDRPLNIGNTAYNGLSSLALNDADPKCPRHDKDPQSPWPMSMRNHEAMRYAGGGGLGGLIFE